MEEKEDQPLEIRIKELQRDILYHEVRVIELNNTLAHLLRNNKIITNIKLPNGA